MNLIRSLVLAALLCAAPAFAQTVQPPGGGGGGGITALTGNCTASGTGSVAITCKAQSAVASSSRDLTTVSGTQVVSGFGFTPSACDGFGAVNGTAPGSFATLSSHSDSALVQTAEAFVAAGSFHLANTFFEAADTTGANTQIAVITAYGSGSVTLTWTKAGTPTGIFTFSIRCFQ